MLMVVYKQAMVKNRRAVKYNKVNNMKKVFNYLAFLSSEAR
jgi:hypothetical protein